MIVRLPEGTVTFLFTDIEGSTRLVAEVGATAYGAMMRSGPPSSTPPPPRAAFRSARSTGWTTSTTTAGGPGSPGHDRGSCPRIGPRVRGVAVLADARPHHRGPTADRWGARHAAIGCRRVARPVARPVAGPRGRWRVGVLGRRPAGRRDALRGSRGRGRALGDEAELANALYNRFFANRPAGTMDDWAASMADADRPYLTEALEIWTRLGDDLGRAKARWALAEHHSHRGETEQTEILATEALAIFEPLGDTFRISRAHFTRAFGRSIAGDVRGVGEDLGPALGAFRQARDVSGMVVIMAALSGVLTAAQRLPDAYRIAGAARRGVTETGLHLAGMWPADLFPAPDPDTADPGLRAALEEGASWSRDEAVDRAIALADELAPS